MMKIHPQFQLQNHSFSNTEEFLKYVKTHWPSHISFLRQWLDNNDFIIAHTSGSTGKPKPVKISKKAMVKSAEKTINFFSLSPQTKALLNLSSDFIAGKMMWVRAFTGGWNLFVSSPDNQSIRQILQKEDFDFGAMVPLQLIANLNDIHRFKKLIIGGGALSQRYIDKIKNIETAVFATYGMTETITHIAVKPLNKKAGLYKTDLFENVFAALPGVSFDIDKRECLRIKTSFLEENIIQTNDIVELIDSHHFEWKGRFDNVINSGGIKLQAEEIEKKLTPYIDKSFFISALPDDKLGEKVVLIIETETPFHFTMEEVLSKYEIPKEIYTIPKFEYTSSGKIQRKKTMEKIKRRD